MAELRPSVAPGPAAPPAPGPSAPPAFASLFPPGLHAIYGECRRLYPDQPNPLQVTAIVKYWFTGTDGPSGFGFELTFRLKRETGESAPPTWPAELMQGLARYVFQSGNGPRLAAIVGVCTEELHSAQQWNGQGILELLRTVPVAGGPWLITDMRRGETIFEIDPHLQQERVDKGIETDGSNLSGVSAKCAWDDLSRPPEDDEDSRSICIGTQPRRLSGKDSLESDSSTAIIPHELIRTRQLESVHLKFNQESGALIPLCLRGRLLHGRHFTYKSITGDMAITFVSTGVEGAFATEEHPYAAHGPWLQILLTEEFVEKMLEDLEELTSPEEFKLPKEYSWPEKKLRVSILPDVVFDSPLH
ncbi:Sufu [Phodopus roborovskii]|uniref:Suppressor of fused homolog n=1 Tax=Phodopus roborovskii TaxID=109678 RepID=A0AAU9ZYJ8_PHORO|nr:Sufu [Phodopus roborovskii]